MNNPARSPQTTPKLVQTKRKQLRFMYTYTTAQVVQKTAFEENQTGEAQQYNTLT